MNWFYFLIIVVLVLSSPAGARADPVQRRDPSPAPGPTCEEPASAPLIEDEQWLPYQVPSFIPLSPHTFVGIAVRTQSDGNYAFSLQRWSDTGTVEWSVPAASYATNSHSLRQQNIAADGQGHVYWGVQGAISKVALDGRVLWTYVAPDPEDGFSTAVATPDQGVVATQSEVTQIGQNVSRLSAAGELVWRTYINHNGFLNALATAADGGVYVTGSTLNGWVGNLQIAPVRAAFLAKLDAAGHLLWVRDIADGPYATQIAVDPRGDLYLGIQGFPPNGAPSGNYVVKTDAEGDVGWALPVPVIAYRLVWHHGYVYATTTQDPYVDGHVYKISPQGTVLWDLELPTGGYYTGPQAIALDRAGEIFVAGVASVAGDGFFIRTTNPAPRHR